MNQTALSYRYDGTFDGLMCCVFESYMKKELPTEILGPDAVEIAKGMMAHQDHLGEVCDARANIRLINEFLERKLPETLVWELTLLRAQNETFLYSTLKASEAD